MPQPLAFLVPMTEDASQALAHRHNRRFVGSGYTVRKKGVRRGGAKRKTSQVHGDMDGGKRRAGLPLHSGLLHRRRCISFGSSRAAEITTSGPDVPGYQFFVSLASWETSPRITNVSADGTVIRMQDPGTEVLLRKSTTLTDGMVVQYGRDHRFAFRVDYARLLHDHITMLKSLASVSLLPRPRISVSFSNFDPGRTDASVEANRSRVVQRRRSDIVAAASSKTIDRATAVRRRRSK